MLELEMIRWQRHRTIWRRINLWQTSKPKSLAVRVKIDFSNFNFEFSYLADL